MKSRSFWAVLCLFALFALPAVAQDWALKQILQDPPTTISSNASNFFANAENFIARGFYYKKQNGSWTYQNKIVLNSNYNSMWHQFDHISSCLDNNYMATVAPTTIIPNTNNYTSSLYIFEKQQNNYWLQTQEITQQSISTLGNATYSSHTMIPLFFKDNFIFLHVADTPYGSSEEVRNIYIYKKIAGSNWQFFKKISLDSYRIIMLRDNKLVVFISNNTANLYDLDQCLLQPNSLCTPNQITIGNEDFYMNSGQLSKNTIVKYSPENRKLYTFTLHNGVLTEQNALDINYFPNGEIKFSYSDKTLVVHYTASCYIDAQGNTIKRYPQLYFYEKGINKWVLKKVIDVPAYFEASCQRLSDTDILSVIDDDNVLLMLTSQVNGQYVQKTYHFQKNNWNIVKGNIYKDSNLNCQKNVNEVGCERYIVKAEPSGIFAITDNNGNYELALQNGSHAISQVIPQNKGLSVTQLCPAGSGTHNVTFNGVNNEVSGYNFGNQVKECMLLTVDVTSRRRRCFRNQTIVKYENEGVATANNAYITVTFPEYVIPLSSTNPWVSKVGNTYKFNVGTLTAGQRGQFVVTDSVACVPNIIGLIQCTEAKIYPKNTCASPTWSGASLEIVGKCLNVAPHKGRFVLRNTGTASMQSAYKVWRGNTLILNNLLALAQGDSLVLEIPTNNENLFIQANQATGHPDGETVSAMVMNCGNDLTTSAGSPNLQMMILPNDEYANSELDCMPIVDSFDPNDKAVSPAGITENNYVKPNTELEFKIRFQNLGTAEAVNIVVIDTLSTHLDLTTFQMMSASHTYKLKFGRVNGKQIAFWTFTDINLPAKSVNEPASHGYIKFKIKHLPTIAEGTIIKNFADIYFDYNEPVRTNETAINMTDYQFPVEPIDYCSLFTQAKAGEARTICGDSYTLEGNSPTMGQGTWTRISGAGEIAEPHKSNSLVTNLGVGENVFRWSMPAVLGCVISQSTVVINRLAPTVSISSNAPNNSICPEENITFSAQTNNVGNAPVYQWKVNNQNVGTNSPTFSSNTLQNQDKVSVEVQTNLDCINTPKITSQPIEMTIKAKPAKPTVSHTALYELKSSVEGDSYAWYKDNVLITNNLPTLKVQKLGKYRVVVTKNGCSSPTSDELVLNSEALKNFADLVKVETYPNPTTGKFTLNVINNQGSEVTVQFYNSLGQLLTEQRVEASEDIDCKVSIDFTRYKQGVYYAKIINQYGLQTTQKIVIQKQ